MKILPRTEFGNPILRATAKPVTAAFLKSPATKTLIKNMFYTMRRVHGVGLAAPQVGKSVRLAVIQVGKFKRVVANPKILSYAGKKITDWEGCLSFTDARGQVPRPDRIKVKYMNEKGQWITEQHQGYAARVFQHETDHLNGIVYVDRMPHMKTLMTHKEFLKRIVK